MKHHHFFHGLPAAPSHSTVSVNVTEHKAPTDDSARLYGELLAKARTEILETLSPANSLLDLTVSHVHAFDSLDDHVVFAFKLNDTIVRGRVPVKTWLKCDHTEQVRAVVEALAAEIVAQLVPKLAAEWNNTWRP